MYLVLYLEDIGVNDPRGDKFFRFLDFEATLKRHDVAGPLQRPLPDGGRKCSVTSPKHVSSNNCGLLLSGVLQALLTPYQTSDWGIINHQP